MNPPKILVLSILMCGFAMSATIISLDPYNNNNPFFSMEDDVSMNDVYTVDGVSNILETVYVSQSLGKSHRFYFTQGERKEGNQIANYSS